QVASDADADAIITSNYGEAGAIDRFGTRALPPVHSGHNALWALSRPAEDAEVVVIVGPRARSAPELFETCEVAARLDNGVEVDNEEQGAPVAVCRGPVAAWEQLWPRFRHLD